MRWSYVAVGIGCLFLSACQIRPSDVISTLIPKAPVSTSDPTSTTISTDIPPTREKIPATFTVAPVSEISSPTSANVTLQLASATPLLLPTNTATTEPTLEPTSTPEESPSATPLPLPSATAGIVATPDSPRSGANLLPNASFEEGWYHINGIPELQVPNRWTLEWQEGTNNLDPDPWNSYLRPESRILSGDFLPAREHSTFIWDGKQTLKIFKKTGAVHFWLTTNVDLQPGTYVFEINFFPDLIEGYTETGGKVWAPDPLSGEVLFIFNQPVGPWTFPDFGKKNTLQYRFDISAPTLVRIGAAFRGRWAIDNNGWFMDDWSLERITTEPPG